MTTQPKEHVMSTAVAEPLTETNPNQPTPAGYCANCGKTPCGWLVERTGRCCATTHPVDEDWTVLSLAYDAKQDLPGMTIDEILAMFARVIKAREL